MHSSSRQSHHAPRPVYSFHAPVGRTLPPLRSLNIPLRENASTSAPLDDPEQTGRPAPARHNSDSSWNRSPAQLEYPSMDYSDAYSSHQPSPAQYVKPYYEQQSGGADHYLHNSTDYSVQAAPSSERFMETGRDELYQEHRRRASTMPVANLARRHLSSTDVHMEGHYSPVDSYTILRPVPETHQSEPTAPYPRYEYISRPTPQRISQARSPDLSPQSSSSVSPPLNSPPHWGTHYPSAPYPNHQEHSNRILSQSPPIAQKPTASHKLHTGRDVTLIQPQQLLSQAYTLPSVPIAPTGHYAQPTVHPRQLQNSRFIQEPSQDHGYQLMHSVHNPHAQRYAHLGQLQDPNQYPSQSRPGPLLMQSTVPSTQESIPARSEALDQATLKIISHCTVLNDFALRYGQLRIDLPSAAPTSIEVAQMMVMANEVIDLMEILKRSDLYGDEVSHLVAKPVGDTSHRQKHTRSQEQSPLDAPEGMGAAEKDMRIIRSKRSSGAVVTAPAVQPQGKYRKRGRVTASGKCHSCNSRETPEWRRGPDGARTLCNACGLQYSKLTRERAKSGGEMPPIDIEVLRASARASEPNIDLKPRTPTKRKASREGTTADQPESSSAPRHPGQGSFQISPVDPSQMQHLFHVSPSPDTTFPWNVSDIRGHS